jgi:hypothetical protein
MADTVASLTEKIEALELALTRQTRTVQFGDRSQTYASFTEIVSAIRYFQAKLAALNNRPKQYRIVANRGLQ